MKKLNKRKIEAVLPAQIRWQDQTPISTYYDDIYFSKDDGVAETEYVFLKQNNLPNAWANKSNFSILETGFGTGLNFFCTLKHWFNTVEANARLTYISVEKYPLSKTDFMKQRLSWPQFSDYIDQVAEVYPPMISGLHQCSLFNGRVNLILLFGDATEQLSHIMASVDVCYLDGFAPSKNKSMWSHELFYELSRLVKVGGTISTFTAVGDVRRGLIEAGFEMKKADAYGQKRHMLTGMLTETNPHQLLKPWYQLPEFNAKNKKAIVVGAGIAGLTTAVSLLQMGWQVTVLEAAASVATGASGNVAGVVMPRLDKQQTTDAQFYWQAFFTALRKITQYESSGVKTGWQKSGVLQLLKDAEDYQTQWPEILHQFISENEAKQINESVINEAALLIDQAGYITPAYFCNNIFEQFKSKINFVFNTQVNQLQAKTEGWRVQTNHSVYESDAVIICNAASANCFEQTTALNLQPVRGQVSYLNSKMAINTVICDKGYAVPLDNQQLLIGATFSRDDSSEQIKAEDHVQNLKQYNNSLRESSSCLDDIKGGRASVRAMTADRLPIVGAVPDFSYYQSQYSDLSKGKKASTYKAAEYHKGLYINAGHGSRGLTSSFLCADLIAALVSNTALPVDAGVVAKLHPARFIIKRLLSGKHS